MIYTLGYAQWTLEQVVEEVEDRDALLVDVRHSPRTSKPGFSRRELEERLGSRYRHVSGFGNVNYKNGPIQLANPEEGAEIVLASDDEPILMCGCRSPATCHRSLVADLLQERTGAAITHLRPPGEREQPDLFDD